MKKSIVFKGVYPALITPFKADGSMDLEGLKANVKYYMSVGCAGVAFSGSSGEHAFLTREERIAGIKACKEVIGDGKIIAGAGAQTTAPRSSFRMQRMQAQMLHWFFLRSATQTTMVWLLTLQSWQRLVSRWFFTIIRLQQASTLT